MMKTDYIGFEKARFGVETPALSQSGFSNPAL